MKTPFLDGAYLIMQHHLLSDVINEFEEYYPDIEENKGEFWDQVKEIIDGLFYSDEYHLFRFSKGTRMFSLHEKRKNYSIKFYHTVKQKKGDIIMEIKHNYKLKEGFMDWNIKEPFEIELLRYKNSDDYYFD